MENNQKNKRGKIKEELKSFFTIRQLSVSELMAHSFYIVLSLLSGARGYTLLNMTSQEIQSSEMYLSLVQYMSIEVWGGLILVLSATLILSVLLPREPKFTMTVFVNLALAVIFFLLSAAAYQNGLSVLNFYNHTIIVVAHVVLAGLGVVGVWRTKRTS